MPKLYDESKYPSYTKKSRTTYNTYSTLSRLQTQNVANQHIPTKAPGNSRFLDC